uniref:Gnk2-homologous domain-containing protein n=1 Tax=Haemonchus placei TaxID=6290 RepID=A0A0N4W6D8_HAEPC
LTVDVVKAITKKEHRFCTGSYGFTRTGHKKYRLSKSSFWYADVDSPLPAFCEIFDDTPPMEHKKIGRGSVRDINIAAVKRGTATCYCNTSIICATQRNTFKNYFSKAGRTEKRVLRRFLKLDVPEAVDELHKFMATSLPKTTTEPTPSTGAEAGDESANPEGLNQEGQHSAANAASDESYDDTRSSPNMLLILGLIALVVLIIIVIIALVPILIKYRKKRRKRWLEKTWDQRVKQAGEELEKVEKEKKEKEKKEAKSKGESSQDSTIPTLSDGGRDPFGAFVSKMGHLDEKGAGL